MHSKYFKYILVALFIFFLASSEILSQNDRRARRRTARGEKKDVNIEEVQLDSAALHKRDSTMRADSLVRADSLSLLDKSSIKLPAFTSAGDSIVEDFSNGNRLIYYYGGVTVEYDNIKLTADYMEYDMSTGIVFARGTYDSTSASWKGRPVMEQGKDKYEMDEVRYNFNSRKARITNMSTTDNEGIIQGQNIKMFPDKSINITKGKYTVCDDEHPHYYMKLTNAAIITEPTQKTVFGPAFPVIEDVTIPVGLPFGFIPQKPQRSTGLLMPTFGEEQTRGFYMRDAGMYFVFGEHFDLSVTGDLYTMGSWAIDVNSRYKVNYKFNGNFNFTYSNDQTGERGTEEFFQSKNLAIKWSHSQDQKSRPGSTFSASVNFSSPSNNKYNSRSVSEALQNQASSSISYSRNWGGKFNLSINGLHSQNSRDSSYTFTLPNVTFSMSTIYPFKKKNRVGAEKFYEKFSIGYSTSLQNKVSFKAAEFSNPSSLLDKFQNGMTHNFSIGLPNFTVLKYLNVNPSVSYGMNWFFRDSEYQYNPETNQVEEIKGKAFNTFGITQTYSGAISMSTRLYGMFNFGKYHKLQAIRHVITPSMSLSYSPELGTAANGWRTLQYTDTSGVFHEYEYNRFSGQIYSAPGKGKNGSISFQIGNNLEAKVKNFADTTGSGVKKVKLIDQLNINGSYNMLADSLNLSNIGITMSTSIFEKISISGNLNLDPYAIDKTGKKINRFNVLETGKLVRLTNASASLSYAISGKGSMAGNDGSGAAGGNGGAGGGGQGQNRGGGGGNTKGDASSYNRVYYHPITGEYIPGGWLYYTNPNSPWSLNFNYSFSYNKSYSYANNELKTVNKFTQTLGVSGNIKATPKLSINFNSGFDFMSLKLTTTQISASYDLHCFNISVSWVPTGQWQSYSFRIAANASALADILRFKKSSSYWDNQ